LSTAPPSIRAQPTPAVSESATPLSRRTAHGFAWLVGQTILSKVTSLAGQLVLAWRLDPKDFGLVGLAFTVSAFGTIVQQVGLKEILIQRQRHFGRWATAAFWMSVALGFLAAALMIAGAPIAARIYGARELIGMVAWIAAAAPIAALSVQWRDFKSTCAFALSRRSTTRRARRRSS